MNQRILILSHDNKIGDAIVATGLFTPLRAHFPDCEIGVLCGASNAALYRFHPDVKWLHISPSRNVFARMWAALKARFIGYDLVVHFGLNLANGSEHLVLKIVKAKQRYLFAKHPIEPLPNDVVIDGVSETSHYSQRHLKFLQTLGLSVDRYQYDIRFEKNLVEPKPDHGSALLIVNSQSSTPNRSLSLPWLLDFISAVRLQHPTMKIQLLSASPEHESELAKITKGLGDDVIVAPFHTNVSHSLQLIRKATVVVTPDTYAVHAASAWNIPVVALYLPSGPTKVWAPLSDVYRQLEAAPEKMVSDIGISDVTDALNAVMASPQSQHHIHVN